MHHLVTSSLCLGLFLYPAYLEASGPVRPIAVAQNSTPESRDPIRAESEGAESSITVHMSVTPPENPIDVTCQTLGAAALENDLPLEFLTRLIWQESRFDAHAVSPAGALGIAQFMPATATGVGLANPFDPAAAIIKSAALLRDLKQRFGNLGLAAAAYNAGPNRVADWLARRRGLPRETQAYVKSVTGHHPDEWTTVEPKQLNLQLPSSVPCSDIIKLLAIRRPVARQEETNSAAVSRHAPTWGVQLVGSSSEVSALASFHQLQKTYRTVLQSQQPLVIRSPAGTNAYWYRIRVGADSRGDAERLCSSLRAVGGTCLVQPN